MDAKTPVSQTAPLVSGHFMSLMPHCIKNSFGLANILENISLTSRNMFFIGVESLLPLCPLIPVDCLKNSLYCRQILFDLISKAQTNRWCGNGQLIRPKTLAHVFICDRNEV